MTAAHAIYDPLNAVVQALRDHGCSVLPAGRDRYEAQCPPTTTVTPPTGVGRGSKGEPKAVVHCHAGCGVADILEALDLEPAALFADYEPDRARTITYLHHIRAWKDAKQAPPKPKLKPWKREGRPLRLRVVRRQPAARVVRYNKIDQETGEMVGKTFTQHRYDYATETYAPGLDGIDVPRTTPTRSPRPSNTDIPSSCAKGRKDADAVTAAWGSPPPATRWAPTPGDPTTPKPSPGAT